ncbi:CotH kinase family protein [Micromonospora chaiyaphumensis]|uniref:Spore coat protein CotH n=1 Tax=Micromonospora chaiyaphumensis TaxID=307119 RepID=A0A1C4WD80_9ACTN|nr:CotH kinase family protein [Micromonospora chaiyaphumensis]SCE94207.1 Spore coat protein CotH [Micromonospora chaiyaphumensis]
MHRVPVRVRHYWKLLATCAAFVVICALVFSTVRVAPLVTSSSDQTTDRVTQDIAGTTDLFDASVAHEITLTYREEDYQEILDDYWDDDEKNWLEADLTIDGTTIPSVGIRLKGNSTLSGLTRNGEARPGGIGRGGPPGGGQMARPGGAQAGGAQPGGAQRRDAQPGVQPGDAQGGGPQAGGGPGGFGRSSLKAEEPENLPWLIRFDEFVEGRRYQGHRELALRVSGMGGGSTVLNEAVALGTLAAAGQSAQRYAYSSFTVNDRPTTARLVVEHPDEGFADTLGDSGVLYKSLATGQFTDQGDDPTDYADDFKQITMKGSQDLQPVINLIRWVNTSSDADFDAHLADHVDVASVARYLATQNLLLNFDDMSGPGRNYYLWYDLETKKFSVVGWDYNLTLSGDATQGPHDAGRMGGGRFPQGGTPPEGFQPPEGMQLPEGFPPPEGMQPPGGDNGVGEQDRTRGFGGMGGNKLKERFLASAAFKTVYEDAYRELYQKIYAKNGAKNTLDSITKVLPTVDGYNAQTAGADVERLRTLIQQRTDHLATDTVITGR